MYTYFYKKYNEYYRKSYQKTGKLFKFKYSLSLKMLKLSLRLFEIKSSYLPSKKSGVTEIKRQIPLIVSLTTFPARINTIWITIETILNQTIKPDKIILWLAQEQFQDINSIPKKLIELQKRGLEIKFCEDLRSHKKYYYTMLNNPKSYIVTIDDDFYYPNNILEELYTASRKSGNIVGASTSRIEKKDFLTPIVWKQSNLTFNDNMVGINSGSGTIFPPSSLNKHLFDKEIFIENCKYADDLWLTLMAHMQGTIIQTLQQRPFPQSVANTQQVSLCSNNLNETCLENNNYQWKNILTRYKEEKNIKEWLINNGIYEKL